MSKTISNFLVGIGFDYDKKSADQIGSGIDSIKSKALQLGSVVAGAFGIKALTVDFVQSADMLGKFSQVFGGTANNIQAMGSALATEGGSLESFMGQLESLERARARIKVGDVGFFAPAGKAGLDPNIIANAETASKAYLGLADSFAKMSAQERINAAEALGLDESSIRLLSQGRASVDALVSKFSDIRPLTDEMTDAAAEFNRQWIEAKANISGVADAVSMDLLPYLNSALDTVNDWTDANRELLKSNATTFTGIAALLVGSGLFFQLSKIAAIIPGIGAGLVSILGLAKSAGLVGLAGAAGYGVGTVLRDNLPPGLNDAIGEIAVDTMAAFGSQEAIEARSTMYGQSEMQLVNNPARESLGAARDGSQRKTRSEQPQVINVNAEFTLDSVTMDRKVIKVINGMTQTAIEDISTSAGG